MRTWASGTRQCIRTCKRFYVGRRYASTTPEASKDLYYFHEGCRFVRPYWFKHKAHAKRHWEGQPLLYILTSHYHRHPPAYYEEAIMNGRITVNDTPARPDQLLGKQDVVFHEMHIHEPAVTSEPIQILHLSSDLVVVHKPAGLPVSLYKYNTLKALVSSETGADTQSCLNRLDASVSGVVLFPLNDSSRDDLYSAILQGTIEKVYYARVQGKFPNDRIDCIEPLVQAETGVSIVDHDLGKSSHTRFEQLGYDSATHTSLVKCIPRTGRRHQIRAHLRWLGYPIANDELYGQQQLVRKRSEFLNRKQEDDWRQMSDEDIIRIRSSQPGKFVREQLGEADQDENCWNCKRGILYSYRPKKIWLHAHQYKGDGWQFTAPVPSWAS